MRKNTNTRNFLWLFSSYALVLLLPILLIGVSYIFITSDIREKNVQEYKAALDSAARLTDEQFSNIDQLADAIAISTEDKPYLIASPPPAYREIAVDLMKFQSELANFANTNSNIDSLAIYTGGSNIFISTSGSVTMSKVFYNALLSYTGLSYEEWNTFIQNRISGGFYCLKDRSVAYLRHIDRNRKNLLLMRIDTGVIDQLLKQACRSTAGICLIVGTDGHLVTCVSDENVAPFNSEEIAEFAEMLACGKCPEVSGYTAISASLNDGWQLAMLVNDVQINERTLVLTRQLILVGLGVLLVGFILCLALTRNESRPLKQLTGSLMSRIPKEYLSDNDGYIFLENSVARLVEHNEKFNRLNCEQQELLDYELMRRLLLGEYLNFSALEKLIAHSKLNLDGGCYAVMTIVPVTGEIMPDDPAKVVDITGDLARVCLLRKNIVCLFRLDKAMSAPEWHSESLEIAQLIREVSSGRLAVGISNLHDSPEQIHTAYEETLILTRALESGESGVMHFESIAPSVSELFYYYPLNVEIQLLKHLTGGDRLKLSMILDNIRTENFSKRRLTAFMMRHLVFELRGTLIRGLSEYAENVDISRALHECCEADSFDRLCGCILNICDLIASTQCADDDNHDQQLKDAIYKYLLENYQNPNLTLAEVAEALDMPEYVLYNFIKNRLNSTFAKFLEALRITKACALMRSGQLSIKEVAGSVGYNSDHTFRQAFKRIMQVTPSDYVSAHQHMMEEMQDMGSDV